MTIRASLSTLALLALGCAPAVAPISEGAIAQQDLRYRLVLDQPGTPGSPSDAAARMGLAIERALATRGILRAAEWEEATLIVHFTMADLVENTGGSPFQSGVDSRVWSRAEDQNCNADHCSMAYWSPLMAAAVPVSARSGAVSIRMETTEGAREIWSGSHLEHNTWSRVGQRRADEIARELIRSLPATHES